MRTTTTIIIGLLVAFAGSFCATAWADEHNVPPPGFTALCNGKDLDGWRGLGHVNPYEIAKWSSEERTAKQEAADTDMRAHWRAEGGEIINDGSGVYLTTAKDYRDFELLLEWRMMSPNTDSGIYLRGCPQVQIWDPANPRDQQNGCDKGSGALWNNQNEAEGKWPLVKADKPIGQWNSFFWWLVTRHCRCFCRWLPRLITAMRLSACCWAWTAPVSALPLSLCACFRP